ARGPAGCDALLHIFLVLFPPPSSFLGLGRGRGSFWPGTVGRPGGNLEDRSTAGTLGLPAGLVGPHAQDLPAFRPLERDKVNVMAPGGGENRPPNTPSIQICESTASELVPVG